jgi:flagellar biosynthesis protein FliR
VLPPGHVIDFGPGTAGATQMFGTLFSCAVRAAAPAMVALLLANVALALLSRTVPQLNAMMVGFPVTIGVGLIAAGSSLPFVARVISGWVGALPTTVETVLRAFEVH